MMATLTQVLFIAISIRTTPPERLGPLFDAIRAVESRGKRNARNGCHLGPYQISPAWWKDAREAAGWPCPGCFESEASNQRMCELLMLAYWHRYCPVALARSDFKTLSRVHNGGPGGAKKYSTLDYWRRVARELKRQEAVK